MVGFAPTTPGSQSEEISTGSTGGTNGIRTHDLLYAKQALSQLSYSPMLYGREYQIRTDDPLIPNQVLYQAEPTPDMYGAPGSNRTAI